QASAVRSFQPLSAIAQEPREGRQRVAWGEAKRNLRFLVENVDKAPAGRQHRYRCPCRPAGACSSFGGPFSRRLHAWLRAVAPDWGSNAERSIACDDLRGLRRISATSKSASEGMDDSSLARVSGSCAHRAPDRGAQRGDDGLARKSRN